MEKPWGEHGQSERDANPSSSWAKSALYQESQWGSASGSGWDYRGWGGGEAESASHWNNNGWGEGKAASWASSGNNDWGWGVKDQKTTSGWGNGNAGPTWGKGPSH